MSSLHQNLSLEKIVMHDVCKANHPAISNANHKMKLVDLAQSKMRYMHTNSTSINAEAKGCLSKKILVHLITNQAVTPHAVAIHFTITVSKPVAVKS